MWLCNVTARPLQTYDLVDQGSVSLQVLGDQHNLAAFMTAQESLALRRIITEVGIADKPRDSLLPQVQTLDPILCCLQVAELLAGVAAPILYWEQGHEWLFGDPVRFQAQHNYQKQVSFHNSSIAGI